MSKVGLSLCVKRRRNGAVKRYLGIILVILMVASIFNTTAYAQNSSQAKVTKDSIFLDGESVRFNGFNISGSNYFKLRDLAEELSGTTSQFDVSWNGQENAIEIITGKPYTPIESEDSKYYSSYQTYSAKPTDSRIIVNGQVQSVTAFNIDNNNYFQLRDLGRLVPFDINFNNNANEIKIYSKVPENVYRAETKNAEKSNAVSSTFPRWSSTVESYLVSNQDHTLSVIEVNEDVTIDTYDADYKLLDKKTIDFELPMFGGFYSGEKYNYIAFGQENREENNDKEVIRIVRYDKQFNRMDSVSVKGGASFTINPFQAGSGRMAESGDTLVFHTARSRYTTADGLNHQSQLTIIVNTLSMTIINDLGRFQKNHVSHSFDQYVLFDGNYHVLVDHGDAYPRSIVLSKGNGSSYSKTDLFRIPGKTGANSTGVSVGGFEMSTTNYIAVMNTVDHSRVKEYTSYEMVGLDRDQRDIIVSVLPRINSDNASVKQITLATYVGSDQIASIPKLVKITDDKLMVTWQEFDLEHNRGSLKYVYINQDGNSIGDIKTVEHFMLSDCQPVIVDKKAVWYTNNNGMRMFYTIPLEG